MGRAWPGPGLPKGGATSSPGHRHRLSLASLPQLETTLREKSQQLEGLQEMRITLEEQLKKEAAAKVVFVLVIS